MVDAPGEHLRVPAETGSVADPAHPERLVGVADVARGPRLRHVSRQPQPGGSRALERAHVRAEVGEEELVTSDVETDNARPRSAGGCPCQSDVRFLVVVSQRTNDDARCDPGCLRSARRAFADRRDHGIDVEAGPNVRERPEAQLQNLQPSAAASTTASCATRERAGCEPSNG